MAIMYIKHIYRQLFTLVMTAYRACFIWVLKIALHIYQKLIVETPRRVKILASLMHMVAVSLFWRQRMQKQIFQNRKK